MTRPPAAPPTQVRAAFVGSGVRLDQLPKPDRPEFALIGRSNVGKSSLINQLARHQGLAKSSASPGKTRLINHFSLDIPDCPALYLVDLPGYGYARASKKDITAWNLMLRRYLRERPNLVCVLQLIDSRLQPQNSDLEFGNQLALWGVPFVLVFTKTDKESAASTHRQVQAYQQAMLRQWESLPEHFLTSSVQGTGREDVLAFLSRCAKDWHTANEAP